MKKYRDLILINFIFLAVGIILYMFTGQRIEILGAVIATGISLSLGIRQSRAENDKIFKELFTEFNTKYDIKFNDKLEEIVNCSDLNKESKLSPKDRKLIIDYLNFCSEEYLWKTKDRIPEEVWKSWENGMVYYLNHPKINQIVVQEKIQKDSYYGLFEKIQNRINNLN